MNGQGVTNDGKIVRRLYTLLRTKMVTGFLFEQKRVTCITFKYIQYS